MIDNELLLQDRLAVIRLINDKYDLLNNSYLAFSGGKDSTVLHYLLDLALPNNNIPRVFVDTGIEYQQIRDFVYSIASNDYRFVILKPYQSIKFILDKYGYPFKSKFHSHLISIYQHSGISRSVRVYLGDDITKNGKTAVISRCPDLLKYNFTDDFKIKCSDLCCKKLKKEPVEKWCIQFNKTIALTGMRNQEGGTRKTLGCIINDKKGNLRKFHPLVKVYDEWERWFIDEYHVVLCSLYYPPFNFKRTGCKGCPFTLDLQEQLDVMEQFLPNERKQCEFIWKPIYDEYRKIGYRIKS